jgi:flagellar biosynthesis protein FliR
MTSFPISIEEILRFVIVLMRITGLMLFAPFFSSQSIPTQSRIIFALLLTLALTPVLPLKAIPHDSGLSVIAPLFLSEIMFGVILGLAASFVFAGVQFAGQIISFQLVFSLINLIDPQSNVEAPVFSFLQNYIALLFFLLMNGHHWFLLAVNESFKSLPVGGIQLSAPIMESLIHLSAQILIIGLRIAGPVLAVSVITDVVMGVIGRASPQVNIMIVGMPLKLLVGFACLSFSFYFVPRLLETIYTSLYKTLFSLVHMMN